MDQPNEQPDTASTLPPPPPPQIQPAAQPSTGLANLTEHAKRLAQQGLDAAQAGVQKTKAYVESEEFQQKQAKVAGKLRQAGASAAEMADQGAKRASLFLETQAAPAGAKIVSGIKRSNVWQDRRARYVALGFLALLMLYLGGVGTKLYRKAKQNQVTASQKTDRDKRLSESPASGSGEFDFVKQYMYNIKRLKTHDDGSPMTKNDWLKLWGPPDKILRDGDGELCYYKTKTGIVDNLFVSFRNGAVNIVTRTETSDVNSYVFVATWDKETPFDEFLGRRVMFVKKQFGEPHVVKRLGDGTLTWHYAVRGKTFALIITNDRLSQIMD